MKENKTLHQAMEWCRKNPGKVATRWDDEEYFRYSIKYEYGGFHYMKGMSEWKESPLLKDKWYYTESND
jgi:hypothetical protein